MSSSSTGSLPAAVRWSRTIWAHGATVTHASISVSPRPVAAISAAAVSPAFATVTSASSSAAHVRELGGAGDTERLGRSATATAAVVVVEHERTDRKGSAHHGDRDDDGDDPAARRRPRLGDHAGSPLGSVVPGAGMSSGSNVLSSSLVASA